MKNGICFALCVFSSLSLNAFAETEQEALLKKKIVALAESYAGQGDPDFSKQKSFDPLITELLQLAPQAPLSIRKQTLVGTWKQVYGLYDYRNDDRGVDPELGVNEIYQRIFEDGYYYNVAPLYKNGDRSKERIGLLRGEYTLDDEEADLINVQFTDYPGVGKRPLDMPIYDLPALAEAGMLPNQITIVSSWIVKWFFGKGSLKEVYTDETLRISYGYKNANDKTGNIYIMTRVP